MVLDLEPEPEASMVSSGIVSKNMETERCMTNDRRVTYIRNEFESAGGKSESSMGDAKAGWQLARRVCQGAGILSIVGVVVLGFRIFQSALTCYQSEAGAGKRKPDGGKRLTTDPDKRQIVDPMNEVDHVMTYVIKHGMGWVDEENSYVAGNVDYEEFPFDGWKVDDIVNVLSKWLIPSGSSQFQVYPGPQHEEIRNIWIEDTTDNNFWGSIMEQMDRTREFVKNEILESVGFAIYEELHKEEIVEIVFMPWLAIQMRVAWSEKLRSRLVQRLVVDAYRHLCMSSDQKLADAVEAAGNSYRFRGKKVCKEACLKILDWKSRADASDEASDNLIRPGISVRAEKIIRKLEGQQMQDDVTQQFVFDKWAPLATLDDLDGFSLVVSNILESKGLERIKLVAMLCRFRRVNIVLYSGDIWQKIHVGTGRFTLFVELGKKSTDVSRQRRQPSQFSYSSYTKDVNFRIKRDKACQTQRKRAAGKVL